MIRKQGDKYVIKSERTGKTLGSYSTRSQAVKRLQQIEMFKHKKGK